jgi:hypothetical protein
MTYEVSCSVHVPDGWDADDIVNAMEDAGLDPDQCSIAPVLRRCVVERRPPLRPVKAVPPFVVLVGSKEVH